MGLENIYFGKRLLRKLKFSSKTSLDMLSRVFKIEMLKVLFLGELGKWKKFLEVERE